MHLRVQEYPADPSSWRPTPATARRASAARLDRRAARQRGRAAADWFHLRADDPAAKAEALSQLLEVDDWDGQVVVGRTIVRFCPSLPARRPELYAELFVYLVHRSSNRTCGSQPRRLLPLALLLTGHGSRVSAAGQPHPTFGRGGVARRRSGRTTRTAGARSPADGKIVVAGSPGKTTPGRRPRAVHGSGIGSTELRRQRHTSTASGRTSGPMRSLPADGKIVVAGPAFGCSAFAPAKYRADGTLDPSFGTGG